MSILRFCVIIIFDAIVGYNKCKKILLHRSRIDITHVARLIMYTTLVLCAEPPILANLKEPVPTES